MDWSERSAGTNGIGTALILGKAFQTFETEHYCRCFHGLTSTGVPIYDEGQYVQGILCMLVPAGTSDHSLGMLNTACLAIQNKLKLRITRQEMQIVSNYRDAILYSSHSAVISVNRSGKILMLNQPAIRLLHLPPQEICTENFLLDLLPSDNEGLKDILYNHTSDTDASIVVHTRKGAIRCKVNTATVKPCTRHEGGIVLSFDVIETIKNNTEAAVAVESTEYKSFNNLIGKNPKFVEQIALAKNAALSDANVLLLGESGTGKDVFAQAIHTYSSRANNRFFAINCSAMPRDLIASELFGYAEGSFTGAKKGGTPGKFEYANNGTIFLDEIGDMPLDLQGHLLRIIENRTVQRIGANKSIPLDVRIIAATNQNLQQAVQKGTFRQDLYYRLNVITIRMIPLRERLDDLKELSCYFYSTLTSSLRPPANPIADTFIQVLQNYDFPGNVRELRNIVERSMAMYPNRVLDASCLPFDDLFNTASALPEKESPQTVPTDGEDRSGDRERVYFLLVKNKGNVSKTAQEMGIARTTLYRKMERYGLSKTFKLM